MSSTTATIKRIQELLQKLYGADFRNFTVLYDHEKLQWVCTVEMHGGKPTIQHTSDKLGLLAGHLFDLTEGKA